jgi:hypothetical protein
MSYLSERLTYDALWRLSEPKRIERSKTVRGPPLEMDSYQDAAYYHFNFKSFPSTTHMRHKGYIKFFKTRSRRPLTAEKLECEVDCTCPDYKFRWAWANKQRGSSRVGGQSLNQALNRAPRITNPKGRPGMCKHLLAAADYIYGLVNAIPDNDAPDTAEKLNRITKEATKRWLNWPSELDAAKARHQRYLQRRAAANIGQTPDDEPEDAIMRRQLPVELPPDTVDSEGGEHKSPPVTGVKGPSQGVVPPASTTAPKDDVVKTKRGTLKRKVDPNGFAESQVVTHDNMKMKLKPEIFEAQKTIVEMEREASLPAPPTAPAAPAGPPAPAMPTSPESTPVSDTAVGAGTEGQAALDLLGEIRDLVSQMVNGGEPEAEGEGDPNPDAPIPVDDEEEQENDTMAPGGKKPITVPSAAY